MKSDTTTSRMGFAGELRDPTGLLYLRARYYDPATAQFLSVDPLHNRTGDGYTYAGGDPFRFADPSGLWPDIVGNVVDGAMGVASDLGSAVASGASSYAAAWESGWSATQDFATAHGGEILSFAADWGPIVGGLACAAVTGGACLILVGAVGLALRAADYAMNADCPTPLGFFKEELPGALFSAATGGLGKLGTKAVSVAKRGRTGANPVDEVATNCKTNSFSGETEIVMADGRKRRIKDLRVGDLVASTSEDGEWRDGKRVTNLIRGYKVQEWVKIELSSGETLHATAEHPFWAGAQEAWIEAENLVPGQSYLVGASGTLAQVQAVRTWTGLQRSYNLTVEDYHTYHVGDRGWWTHNETPCPEVGGFVRDEQTHVAEVTITSNGEKTVRATYVSGNMTPEEKALGFPRSSAATHTEVRATNNHPLGLGDNMLIEGLNPPCTGCRGAMKKATAQGGKTLTLGPAEIGLLRMETLCDD